MSSKKSRTNRFAKVPALLVAASILMVGLAGTATAAKMITGKQIKNNTVTTQDIQNQSLKGVDIKNGSLGESDLNTAAKEKLNAPNITGYEVRSANILVGSGGQETLHLSCTAGKVALTGGGSWNNTENDAVIQESLPQKVIRGDSELFAPADPTFADGWKITAQHNGLDPKTLTGYVVCVNPS